MKNKEKYLDEILNMFVSGDNICEFKIRYVLEIYDCKNFSCAECSEKTKKWLEQECKEPIKLTEDEKAILRNVDKRYKYIARTINTLEIFETKPRKDDVFGWVRDKGVKDTLRIFGHLFAFIKSTDKEPYLIEDLLNDR